MRGATRLTPIRYTTSRLTACSGSCVSFSYNNLTIHWMLRKKSLRRGKQAKTMKFITSLDSSVSLSFVHSSQVPSVSLAPTPLHSFGKRTVSKDLNVFFRIALPSQGFSLLLSPTLCQGLILEVVDLKGTVLGTLNRY